MANEWREPLDVIIHRIVTQLISFGLLEFIKRGPLCEKGERGGGDQLFSAADYSIIRSSITHAHEHSDRDDSGSRLMRAPDRANPCQIGCWWIADKRLGWCVSLDSETLTAAHTVNRWK